MTALSSWLYLNQWKVVGRASIAVTTVLTTFLLSSCELPGGGDSGAGRICFPWCPGQTSLPTFAEKAEKKNVATAEWESHIKFDRGISVSVDNFFARYRRDNDDPDIKRIILGFLEPGLEILEHRFGTIPTAIKYEAVTKQAYSVDGNAHSCGVARG